MIRTLFAVLLTMWWRRFGVPPCQKCGLCCAPGVWTEQPFESITNWVYADVQRDAKDKKRLGKRALLTIVSYETGKCGALAGDVGKDVSCTIYKSRPRTCRNFKRGGDMCIAILQRSVLPHKLRYRPWYREWTWQNWRIHFIASTKKADNRNVVTAKPVEVDH